MKLRPQRSEDRHVPLAGLRLGGDHFAAVVKGSLTSDQASVQMDIRPAQFA